MVDIPMRSSVPYDRNSITNLNVVTQGIITTQNIIALNAPKHNTTNSKPVPDSAGAGTSPALQAAPAPAVRPMTVPRLVNQMQKGQKLLLDSSGTVRKIHVCLGWNVLNPQCDIDVSAFLLGSDNKVPGDDWFVFYGQEYSPDKTVRFSASGGADREYISIDLARLNPDIQKIVFVLTINDALRKHLNFSMVKDAYMRILNADSQQELASFQITDYYANVISMMIGEIYLHAGKWKCSAVGNGVAKDLEGLCGLYGVQVI